MTAITLTQSAKLMNNNTICLGAKITKAMGLKKGDPVILSFMEDGSVHLLKGVSSWEDFAGMGKETFDSLGGGENFLKELRKDWD